MRNYFWETYFTVSIFCVLCFPEGILDVRHLWNVYFLHQVPNSINGWWILKSIDGKEIWFLIFLRIWLILQNMHFDIFIFRSRLDSRDKKKLILILVSKFLVLQAAILPVCSVFMGRFEKWKNFTSNLNILLFLLKLHHISSNKTFLFVIWCALF